MFKKIVLVLVALIVLLAVVTVFLPSTVHVERSIDIERPPSTVFALVDSFVRFDRWAPIFDDESRPDLVFDGPVIGTGAKVEWSPADHPNRSSTLEITTSEPFERVEMTGRMCGRGDAAIVFGIEPAESGTRLTWTFDVDFGKKFWMRVPALVLRRRLDDRVGRGLARLKETAESLPEADWSEIDISVGEQPARPILYVSGRSETDSASIGQALTAAFGRVAETMRNHGLQQAGAPMAIARSWNEKGYVFDAAIPYSGGITEDELEGSPVRRGATQPGLILRAVHVGPYRTISSTYEKVRAFMEAHGFTAAGDPWESYVSDPTVTPQEELVTVISYPVKAPDLQ